MKYFIKCMIFVEIINKLGMEKEGRESERLLQYRRTILKIPANKSKYLTNEKNEELIRLIKDNWTNKAIIAYFGLDKLDSESLRKLNATISVRRYQYKNKKSIKK